MKRLLNLFLVVSIVMLGVNSVNANSDISIPEVVSPVEANFDKIFKNGDLIFIQSTTTQSQAITEVTSSKWTHVGIANKNEKGKWEVIEAINPVQITSLRDFISINRGIPSKNPKVAHFVVKRLKPDVKDKKGKVIDLSSSQDWSKLLSAIMAVAQDITIEPKNDTSGNNKTDGEKLREAYKIAIQKGRNKSAPSQQFKFMGKPYDIYFEWSDDAIYCSELTYKAYQDAFGINLGKIETWGELKEQKRLDGEKARALVNARLTRAGKVFKHHEEILTPVSQFNSDLLHTAYDSDTGIIQAP